jgi:plastocyanin
VRSMFVAGAGAIAALAGCGGVPRNIVSAPTPADAHQVVIYEYRFKPQMLTVSRGTSISWVNRDMAPHTATRRSFNDEPFDSGHMIFDAAYTHTFEAPGSFHYLCIYHPGMQGTIVVQ